MRVHFDEQADALYMRLDDTVRIVDSEEVRPGVVLDFDEHDRVGGIEILGVKGQLPLASLKSMRFDVA